MLELNKILGSRVDKKGLAKSMEAGVVCEKFDKWARDKFGEAIGRQVRAVHFKRGVLTIKTASSVLSQDIKLKESDIKKEVNGILGEEVIRGLAFRN